MGFNSSKTLSDGIKILSEFEIKDAVEQMTCGFLSKLEIFLSMNSMHEKSSLRHTTVDFLGVVVADCVVNNDHSGICIERSNIGP